MTAVSIESLLPSKRRKRCTEKDIHTEREAIIGVHRFFRDIRRYWPYAVQSAKALLKAEVAGSYLNWLWWILNPICFMLTYTLIFGVVFHAAEPYFPIFVFIGLTLWEFFSRVVTHSVRIVKDNRNIVCRVYLPKFILILSDMLVNGFKMLISFGVVAVMLLLYRVPLRLSGLYVMPVLIGLFLFTFGLGNLMMHLGVYIRDLISVINIVMRLAFYFTGIFYDIEKRIPTAYARWLIRLNPVAGFLNEARSALLYGRITHVGMLMMWILLSTLLCIGTIHLVYQNENGYGKVI